MVRAGNHGNGLPAIQTGGNVGVASWFIAWKILKIPIIALIGINHGWEEDDPIEKIISHGFENKSLMIEANKENIQRYIKKIYNPDFACYCILDPIYQFYSTIFKDFITKVPSWVKTINSTEGGSIFGNGIVGKPLQKFLDEYKF